MQFSSGVDMTALASPRRPDARSEPRHSFRKPSDALTPRELEVCQLLLAGCSVKEAAARCNIQCKTAALHTSNLYRKLDVHSRAELFNRFAANPVIDVREVPRSAEHAEVVKRLERIEGWLEELTQHVVPALLHRVA